MRHAHAPTPRPAARSRGGLLFVLALAACLGLPSGAFAGRVLDEEVSNLRETAKNLAIAAATKGNSVRGASGYLDSMLRQSDQLICNSWILGFSLSVRRMAIDLGDSPSPEELKAYQAMVNLRDKIVEKCGPITDPDTHAAMRGGAGAAAEEDEESETEAPSGRTFVPRKNWNIVDQICWDQCSRQYYAYRRAAREAEKRNAAWEKARKASADAKQALDQKKAELARLEAEAEAQQAESDRLQDLLRPASGSRRGSLVDRLGDALLARNRAKAAAGRAREAITRLRKAWKKAGKAEATAARLAKAADADANSALRAYHECVKRCYASAQSAGESGAARDTLRDNPNAPYTSGADRRKMLERLRQMRQQEESRSARESARQAQGSQALLTRPTGQPLHRMPAPATRTSHRQPEPEARTSDAVEAPARPAAAHHEQGADHPTRRAARTPVAPAPEPGATMREPRQTTLRPSELSTGSSGPPSESTTRGSRPTESLGRPRVAPLTTDVRFDGAALGRGGAERAPAPPSPPAGGGRMIQVAPPVLTIPAGPGAGAL